MFINMIGKTLHHFRYSNKAHKKLLRVPKNMIRANYFVLAGHTMLSLSFPWVTVTK